MQAIKTSSACCVVLASVWRQFCYKKFDRGLEHSTNCMFASKQANSLDIMEMFRGVNVHWTGLWTDILLEFTHFVVDLNSDWLRVTEGLYR